MIFALAVVMLAGLVTASSDLSSIASLDTSRLLSGEIWRLFSGHLTHLTWRQYAVDAPVFFFLFAAYTRRFGHVPGMSLALFSALSVSATVALAGVHQLYGGLSGLSCAAFSAIILTGILERPRAITGYLMTGMYGVYLLFAGGIASGVDVAREAHFAGALSGVVFELMRYTVFKSKQTARDFPAKHLFSN
jgi:membrane associated rhomboid family serine protease